MKKQKFKNGVITTSNKKTIKVNSSPLDHRLKKIQGELIEQKIPTIDSNLALKILLYGSLCKSDHNFDNNFKVTELIKQKKILNKNINVENNSNSSFVDFISYYPLSKKMYFYHIGNVNDVYTFNKELKNVTNEVDQTINGKRKSNLNSLIELNTNGVAINNYEIVFINFGKFQNKHYVVTEHMVEEQYFNNNFFLKNDDITYCNHYSNSFSQQPPSLNNRNGIETAYRINVPISEVLRLYQRYGRKVVLKNTREPLGKGSIVTKDIIQTLSEGEHLFNILHNGITIVTKKCDFTKQGNKISLENFSVINGGNTLEAIRQAVENEKVELNDDLDVIEVKLVEATNETLISLMNKASNKQNPVKNVDLLSNDDNQVYLKNRLFDQIGIDLQIKNGENSRHVYFPKHRRIKNIDFYQLMVSWHYESPIDARDMKNNIFDPDNKKIGNTYNKYSKIKTLGHKPRINTVFDDLTDKDGVVISNIKQMDELLFTRHLHRQSVLKLKEDGYKDLFVFVKKLLNNKSMSLLNLNHNYPSNGSGVSFEDYFKDGYINRKSIEYTLKNGEKKKETLNNFFESLNRHLKEVSRTYNNTQSTNDLIEQINRLYMSVWRKNKISSQIELIAIPFFHKTLKMIYNKNQNYGFNYAKFYDHKHRSGLSYRYKLIDKYVDLIIEPLVEMVNNHPSFSNDITSFMRNKRNITHLDSEISKMLNQKTLKGSNVNYFQHHHNELKKIV